MQCAHVGKRHSGHKHEEIFKFGCKPHWLWFASIQGGQRRGKVHQKSELLRREMFMESENKISHGPHKCVLVGATHDVVDSHAEEIRQGCQSVSWWHGACCTFIFAIGCIWDTGSLCHLFLGDLAKYPKFPESLGYSHLIPMILVTRFASKRK
ncbi:MAG: hypothetical protein ETSY2_44700 [Candidatus Entotheonella gemina]|uniref:Uncharacterized protein n=1 Tax=Candidatus Entotheonella gemina TaxID=1429439 RepID=W4LHF4_9BACT|nr:MAG: hypothetical protein ETSY2_44700 [Candidatus Entotheonella gemina]